MTKKYIPFLQQEQVTFEEFVGKKRPIIYGFNLLILVFYAMNTKTVVGI